MPFFTGFPDRYEKQLGDIYMDWPRLNLYFWNGTEWVAFVGRDTLRKECDAMTYELTFGERVFYANTIDEVFNIIGECDGDYSIRRVEDGER